MKLNVLSVSDMTRKNAVGSWPIISSSSSSSLKNSRTAETANGARRTLHDAMTEASVSGDPEVDLKPLYCLMTKYSSEACAAASSPPWLATIHSSKPWKPSSAVVPSMMMSSGVLVWLGLSLPASWSRSSICGNVWYCGWSA